MPALANAKHEAFCREYVTDLNGTKAAQRSGYSPGGAHVQASRMLSHVKVQARIAELQADRWRRLHMTADEVLATVARRSRNVAMQKAMFTTSAGDPFIDLAQLAAEERGDIVEVRIDDYTEGRGDDAREVRAVKVKVTSPDKNTELVMKHLGLLRDQVDVTVTMDDVALLDAARRRARGEE